MRNFSLAMKTNSAYARLPLNGATLPELQQLHQLAHERRSLGIDMAPRLRRKPEPLGVPADVAALVAQSLDPNRVAAWLRQEGL